MQQYSRRRRKASSRRFPRYAIALFTFAALLFIGCSILLMYSMTTQAKTSASSSSGQAQQTSVATPTIGITTVTTPVMKPTMSSNPQATPTHIPTPSSTISTTPTLVPSTPQTVQTGVFSLSSGGPIPVSESILHPTNIARTMLNGSLVSIYAGSLAADPQQGVLCVLHENLTTGQFNIQVYQSPRRAGTLTILAIQGTTLTLTDSQGQGIFDLATNQFRW